MVTIEDKINLFSKIIYGEVDDKINSELDELENVEKDTIEKEEREVKKYRNKNIQSVEKKIKSKFEKEVFKLKLEEQQQLLNLKENMINETLESLKERIIDFTKSDEYINYIKSHLDNTLKDIENKESIIIYFNKKDLEKFKKVINKDNVEVSNESKDIIGGYIIQDKNNKFRVDCSLEISIEECKEKIGISITELFM
ncbi:hypothetical protein K144313037_20960 [Clostridium tetani]|uniref:V-type proton ATPase subunit E n=1 Tax=Clostridium tetani TaxID=1513 RepID=A0A4Q0VDY0_CLOTA|nr:V-type ATP synthase subunit E family protein [Clostridium tetani]AVP53902.1 hypothetical protein C3B72_01735 [Clostridium tetani]KGI45120.1 hypothetical protein KY55_00310 [Clostridium tetani]RXI48948.1 hypothetical protein DP130_05925 [Clostridium tetani]RXI73580.1 hypothetical protein DP127_03420 [Clostridium tetani]RXI77724.1 hypothetical protein DP128_02450 [Clostridium tetani]